MTGENKEIPLKIHEALTATGLEYAALSWNGFNLFGDRRSIDEAKRLLHAEGTIAGLRIRLLEAERLAQGATERGQR